MSKKKDQKKQECPVYPIGKRFLAKKIEEKERQTNGGLHIPDSSDVLKRKAKILKVGDKIESDVVKEGDIVFHKNKMQNTFQWNGEKHFFLTENQITSKIDKDRYDEII